MHKHNITNRINSSERCGRWNLWINDKPIEIPDFQLRNMRLRGTRFKNCWPISVNATAKTSSMAGCSSIKTSRQFSFKNTFMWSPENTQVGRSIWGMKTKAGEHIIGSVVLENKTFKGLFFWDNFRIEKIRLVFNLYNIVRFQHEFVLVFQRKTKLTIFILP